MKRISLCFALSILLYACQRKINQQDTKEQLEKAMTKYLDDRPDSKSGKLHFDVQDVTYFEDSTFYLCRFKVKMTLANGQDTTGIMQKKLSKNPLAVQ
jgi:hypothetical protein